MNNDENIVDIEFQEAENEIYITAPQLAQKINDTDIRVRHWADKFGDLIGIEKINGRKKYKESDIPSFAFIKDLIDSKNFSHEQVRNYIEKHGFKYAEYDSGLVNPKDPLGFQALASALSVEVDNKLSKFSDEFTKQFIEKISNTLVENLYNQQQMNIELKAEIEASVDNIISEKLQSLSLKVENSIENQLQMQIDEQERRFIERDIKNIELIKQHMDERKKENEIEKQNKKGFWSRIFGR